MDAEVNVENILIKTERLLLRPFAQADLDDFYEYAKVEGVGEAAGWVHHQSIEETKKVLSLFIKEKKTLAIVEQTTGKVIGSLGLEHCDSCLPDKFSSLRGREIGYVLAKDKWGQGYMSEAVKAVVTFCFLVLKFDFLSVEHNVKNVKSRRVIEKTGFSFLFERELKTFDDRVNIHHMYIQTNNLL